ncbi:MAG: hypothetical protein HY204_10860 [Nitrospirae bacterium]|nr:hypothetical protein [Nitrospirota bacterium]
MKKRIEGKFIGLMLSVTLLGCRAKIAGDDYIIGPFPAPSQQERSDRDRNLQSPAPEKEKSDPKNKEDKP